MGIRMLHRRAVPGRTQAQAHAGKGPSVRPPVQAHAAAASTARIPFHLATLLRRARARASSPRIRVRLTTTLRHAAADLRHRVTFRDRDVVEGEQEEPSGHRLWAEPALTCLAVNERAGDRSLPGRRTPGPGATA